MKEIKESDIKKLLFQKLIEGNLEAFKMLHYDYKDQIFAYSLVVIRDELYAQEITKQVFLKIWMNRDRLNSSLPFKEQLYDCAESEIFDFLQKAKCELEKN